MTYFTNNFENAFGIDLSRYNTSADGRKQVSFDVIAAHAPRVVFAGMRAGISWGYQDAWFAAYFNEAKRVNCLRMPYHVVYLAESAVAQMDNFLRIVGEADLADVRLVLDMELSHDCTQARITETLNACLRILERRTGRLPIVYSRAGWVDENLCVADLPKLDWWLAQYRMGGWPPLQTYITLFFGLPLPVSTGSAVTRAIGLTVSRLSSPEPPASSSSDDG